MSPRSIALATLVGLALHAPGSAVADLTTGLIAWYPLDGSAQDASGQGNHGTIVGALASTTDRFGTPGMAMLFNGTNTYITVPASPSLDSPTTALTQCAWVYLNGHSLVGSPFDPITMKSAQTTNAFMYRLYCAENTIGVNYGNWNTGRVTAPFLEVGRWAHVASTWDGATIRQYLDGSLLDSVAFATTLTPDSRPLLIGADVPGLFEVFNGKLDELRIYNRALSGAEIAQLAGNTVGVAGAPPGALRFVRAVPNPSRQRVQLEFGLPVGGDVRLELLDLQGRRLAARRLALPAGTHRVALEAGRPLRPGVYLARLAMGGDTRVSRITLLE